jgi:hypothetical protein
LKALTLFGEIGDMDGTALVSHKLGLMYAISGKLGQARHYLHETVRLYKELGDNHAAANSYRFYSKEFLQHGSTEEGCEFLREAAGLYWDSGLEADSVGTILFMNETGCEGHEAN